MESLYHQTNGLIQETQSSFGKLERLSGRDAEGLEHEIQARIDRITSNCEKLDVLVHKEPPSRRQNAKLRADQLRYDCQHLQAALRNLQHRRFAREREVKDREELLSRRFAPNDSAHSETSIMIDHALQHHTSLQGAHQGMDGLLDSGHTILQNIREQRDSLKGIQKKILDVANFLGLSNSVLRLIERRTAQDRWILYGGIIVTCLIMFLVIRYYLWR